MSLRTKQIFALCLSHVLALGCGPGGDSSSGDVDAWEVLRSSSADTIIIRTVNTADVTESAALISELKIGMLDGPDEYIFGGVAGVAVGPEGNMFVLDYQVPVVREFSPTGDYLRDYGRDGEGPGEYRQPMGLAVGVDGRVFVWDPSMARLNIFSPEGEALDSWRVAEASGLFGFDLLVVDTTGGVYVRTTLGRPNPNSGWRTGFLRLSPNGELLDTISPPQFDYDPPTLYAERGGGRTIGVTPFMPQVVWALGSRGEIAAGLGEEYQILVMREGEPLLRIERDAPRVPVTAEEREAKENQVQATMRRRDPSWSWNGPPIPHEKPFFNSLAFGDDGQVWVRLHVPAARRDELAEQIEGRPPATGRREPTVFDVFSSDGRYRGQVRVPDRTTIWARRGDHVWGVTRDSLDVQYVERFRIEGLREQE